jgi:thioredoxin 1
MVISILIACTVPLRSQDSLTEKKPLKNLTVEEFTKLTKQKGKEVLVNFSASWCVVCKKQKPVLDELAARHRDDLALLEIDMEENPLIAEYFEIDGLPVNIIFRNGVMDWNRVGFQSLNDLENALWSYNQDQRKQKSK